MSRISTSRLLIWIVPLGSPADVPAGVGGWYSADGESALRNPRAV